jgi:tRNA (guanine-N7-)-methyltransferase
MTSWDHALDGATFWRRVFANDAPVEIEIGSGDGVFLESWAARCPSRNFLGLERSPAKARRLSERFTRRSLPNVRTLQADARCLVSALVPEGSVAAYHVYFPDPWPKRGHAPRRIFTPDFVTTLARTLVPGGRLWFATDVAGYAGIARGHALRSGFFREERPRDEHPGLTTSFARKYRADGRALQSFMFERIAIADADQLLAASKIRSM